MYCNRLGEFVVDQNSPDWVRKLAYIERRPAAVRGAMNPWETERQRILWQAEEDTWRKIVPLQGDYARVEEAVRKKVAEFNTLIPEFEQLTKSKLGFGQISQYGSMALAIIPGFGWAAAAFGILGNLLGLGSGKKKRIEALVRRMEAVQIDIQKGQDRLLAIQREIAQYMTVTESVAQQQQALMQYDRQQTEEARVKRQQVEQFALQQHRADVAMVRQISPKRLLSDQGGQL